MGNSGDEHDAPVLSDEGARRLRNAIERHVGQDQSSRLPSEHVAPSEPVDRFRLQPNDWWKPEQVSISVLDVSEESVISPDAVRDVPVDERGSRTRPDSQRTGAGRALAAMTAILIPLLVVAAIVQLSGSSEETVTTEVAGTSIDSAVNEPTAQVDTSPTDTTSGVSDVEGAPAGAQGNDGGTELSRSSVVPGQVEPGDGALADIVVVPSDGLELVVFDSEATQGNSRTFAVRVVSTDEAAMTIPTSSLQIAVQAATGEFIDAAVQFIHEDVPPGSSAVGSVSLGNSPAGQLDVILTSGEIELDRATLR